MASQMDKLRTIISENIRVQRGGAEPVDYVDVSNALPSVRSRQNHVIFGRRGCGKTLLLLYSARDLPPEIKVVYLNCEDFKNHSFPNVLIEILHTLFKQLESHVGGWFGKKKRCKELLRQILAKLGKLREQEDELVTKVREQQSTEQSNSTKAEIGFAEQLNLQLGRAESNAATSAIETEYQRNDNKIRTLNLLVPELKSLIREVFTLSTAVKTVFIQLDDFYHLQRSVQPHVMDYIHRLCKDVSLFFKVATLRHASILYLDREGQPTGAQERHDYQPISIDFTLQDVHRTEEQIRKIFHALAKQAEIQDSEFDDLFRGEGFRRLVLAGGGVPRDCLSLFLNVTESDSSQKIGKDDVRIRSLAEFQRRIEDLKTDAQRSEQDVLLRGIYVLRQFCLDKQNNVFLISEQLLQSFNPLRELTYRLMDYRIIHNLGTAYTHKSHPGTFQAFMIDIGSYAHLRKLSGRFTEIDLFEADAKERIRAAPVVEKDVLLKLWNEAPSDVENALLHVDA